MGLRNMNLKCVDKENNVKEQIEVKSDIFEIAPSVPILHQVVRMQLAARRSGTASTKTRSDVRGGGKKPWRQKGSGRARAGTTRSPVWVGGGSVFGPHPRSYAFSVPKKMKKSALKGVLSMKAADGKLLVIDSLNLEEPKTRQMIGCLTTLGLDKQKVLIIESEKNINLLKSVNNIPGVDVLLVDGLNVYDMMWHDKLLITQAALNKIEERLG